MVYMGYYRMYGKDWYRYGKDSLKVNLVFFKYLKFLITIFNMYKFNKYLYKIAFVKIDLSKL